MDLSEEAKQEFLAGGTLVATSMEEVKTVFDLIPMKRVEVISWGDGEYHFRLPAAEMPVIQADPDDEAL